VVVGDLTLGSDSYHQLPIRRATACICALSSGKVEHSRMINPADLLLDLFGPSHYVATAPDNDQRTKRGW